MTSSPENILWIARERMVNGLVIEQSWPTSAGYGWCAALLAGDGRVLNWRSGVARNRDDAEALADGSGMWLGSHRLAFVLVPGRKGSRG